MKFQAVLFLATVMISQTTLASGVLGLLLEKNHFALLRHAEAPGIGDPENFKIDDCKTQRNLSAKGRSQATALGKILTAALGKNFWIFSSQWCRCKDTAQQLGGKDPLELPILNSFFQERTDGEKQTRELKSWLKRNLSVHHPLILVTHQVNITKLTGIFPSEGEIIVLKMDADGKITTVGSRK